MLMQTISEPIPNLRPLNKIINLINDYADINTVDNDKVQNLFTYWIAGGAIASRITGEKINDYDIFTPDPTGLIEKLKNGVGYVSFENDTVANFIIDGNKIQVVKRYSPNTPEDIFSTFDFTIVCGAYDGTTFYCHDRFWRDIANRRLVINILTFPLRTLERIAKYAKRGYTTCPVGLLTLAKTINAMSIDWDNPAENELTYYADGTPRFTGPD